MLLHDLVRGARGKGVALAGEVGPGHRFGYGHQRIAIQSRGQHNTFQPGGDQGGNRGADFDRGGAGHHAMDRQDITHPIHHRQGGINAKGPGLGNAAGQNLFDIIHREVNRIIRALADAGRIATTGVSGAACAAARTAATATDRGDDQNQAQQRPAQ